MNAYEAIITRDREEQHAASDEYARTREKSVGAAERTAATATDRQKNTIGVMYNHGDYKGNGGEAMPVIDKSTWTAVSYEVYTTV